MRKPTNIPVPWSDSRTPGLLAGSGIVHFGGQAMLSARKVCLVLVTAPDRKTARLLAQAILRARLAACVNLVPGLESHYWWRSKLERSQELLLVIKTAKSHLRALEKLILREHPYDTPEFLTLPLGSGSRRYLEWLTGSLKPRGQR